MLKPQKTVYTAPVVYYLSSRMPYSALQHRISRRVEASASSRDLGLDAPRLFGDLDMDIQTDMQRQFTDMQRSFQQMEQEVTTCAAVSA